MRNLKNRRMILKPGNRRGTVLINKNDYYNLLERFFSNKMKFEIVNNDPASRNLSAVQNYLNFLFSQTEITEGQKLRCDLSVPRLEGTFDTLACFRRIVDIANTLNYGTGQFLSKLLNPLTQNAYSAKDSFDSVKS